MRAKKNYKNYLPKNLREAYVQAAEDPDKLDLTDEMSLLRGLLGTYLKQMVGEDGEMFVDNDTIKGVTTLIDKIGKTQVAISNHQTKMRENIPVRMIPVIIQGICNIVKSVVDDERLVTQISERIGNIPMLMRNVDAEIIK